MTVPWPSQPQRRSGRSSEPAQSKFIFHLMWTPEVGVGRGKKCVFSFKKLLGINTVLDNGVEGKWDLGIKNKEIDIFFFFEHVNMDKMNTRYI